MIKVQQANGIHHNTQEKKNIKYVEMLSLFQEEQLPDIVIQIQLFNRIYQILNLIMKNKIHIYRILN